MSLDISRSWTIYGPAKDYLDTQEVIICLRRDSKTLRQLIKEGRLPPGIRATRKGKAYWPSLIIAAFLLLEMAGAKPGADAGEDEGEEGEKTG